MKTDEGWEESIPNFGVEPNGTETDKRGAMSPPDQRSAEDLNTYTVIAYVVPDGGHLVETVRAETPSAAALAVRTRLGLKREEFEIVGVAEGQVPWTQVDETKLALAPYSPASP